MVSIVELKLDLSIVLLKWSEGPEMEKVESSARESNDPVGVFNIGTSRLDRFGELQELGMVTYVRLLLRETVPADSKELMLPKELML